MWKPCGNDVELALGVAVIVAKSRSQRNFSCAEIASVHAPFTYIPRNAPQKLWARGCIDTWCLL